MKKGIFKLFVLALVAFSFGSCGGDNMKPGDTVLIVKLSSGPYDQVYIQQELGTEYKVDTVKIGEDGTFKFVKRLEKPAYFTFFVDRSRLTLYLHPSDTLRFDDGGVSVEDGKFSGATAVYNDYLLKYNNKQTKFQTQAKIVFGNPEDVASRQIDSIRKTDLDNLEGLAKSFENIDELFLNTEKERIKYSWALNRLLYPLYYGYFNGVQDYKTSPNFEGYLNEIDVNDSKLLVIGEYRNFLNNYLGVKAEAFFKDSTIEATEKTFTVYQLKVIDKEFKNEDVKNYLAFKTMSSHVMYEGIKDYEIVYPVFTKVCKNQSFTQNINDQLKAWEHLKKGKAALDFGAVNLAGDTIMFSSLKGKYVYVDVWATWCEPCKAEIPYLKSLVDELAGRNITFVSLSVDKDKDAWSAMVKSEGLKGVQLYLGVDQRFSDYYKVTGIPRFMLFDMEGNIVETSADRPSANIKEKLLVLPGI